MSSPSYRPDIDGLRALAVVPVVLFHAAVPGFSGGYVGVDVFFVISGFLITQIVAREIAEERFSLSGFYARRIRRIFPALAVMLAATLATAALFFLPDDFEKLGATALAALFSVSNIVFFLQAGYFDDAALVKPLLHTWSLAVEEQYYLYLPLLLLAMKTSRPGSRRLAVALIALGSLALAIAKTPDSQSYAFYRLPPRAWELLAGSLLALGAVPAVAAGKLREALAGLGLVLIAAPVFLYHEKTSFPGLAALAPVLGAALVLHCAPGTLTGRMLGLALPRGIGLISYSLYLWHWPVIVFMTYYHQAPLTGIQSVTVVTGSVVLAILSWKFVEQPFRTGRTARDWPVFASAGAATALIGVAAAVVVQSAGLPQRFPAELARYSKAAAVSPLRATCHVDAKDGVPPEKACRLGDAAVAPTVALWGDSHGVELAYALGERESFSLLQLTASSCPPSTAWTSSRRSCIKHNRSVLRFLEDRPEIKTVILTAYFESDFRRPERRYEQGMLATAEALMKAGKKVIFVGPVPKQGFDVPRKLMLAAVLGGPKPAGRRTSSFLRANRKALRLMDELRKAGAAVVLPHEAFCDRNRCAIERDGRMLYFDDHHPSLEGARLIAGMLDPLLPGGLAPAPRTSSLP